MFAAAGMPGGKMGAKFHSFSAQEGVVLDTARIMILRRSLGDQRTREVVEEVVFHLTDRMGLLRAALDEARPCDAQALGARLAALSEQVGLTTFAQVARDLVGCIEAQDEVAIGAVAARLERLADQSLYSVLHYADQSAL